MIAPQILKKYCFSLDEILVAMKQKFRSTLVKLNFDAIFLQVYNNLEESLQNY